MDLRSVVMLGVGLWAMVVLAAVYVGVDVVERDLTLRSRVELATAGQRWAQVHFDGRDATLAGGAPSAEAQEQVRALVLGLAGVRKLNDETKVAPPADSPESNG
ncbi:MAG: hypothetical protein AAF637_07870 [Pseudomonadota bacterium]